MGWNRDSTVGIATSFWLNERGLMPGRGIVLYSVVSIPALEPTKTLVQWVLGTFSGECSRSELMNIFGRIRYEADQYISSSLLPRTQEGTSLSNADSCIERAPSCLIPVATVVRIIERRMNRAFCPRCTH
jgi:hypothetical protein